MQRNVLMRYLNLSCIGLDISLTVFSFLTLCFQSEENRVKRRCIRKGLASEEAQASEEPQAQAQQEQGPSTNAQTSQHGSDD